MSQSMDTEHLLSPSSRDSTDAPQQHQPSTLNIASLICLTVCLVGVQFTWSVELAYGTPYLLELGLPKALTALVWLAGPLSGLLVQPIVGAYSDISTLKMGRRRPFIIVGGFLVVLSVAMIAYAKELGLWISKASNDPDKATLASSITILIAVIAFYVLDFSINAVQAVCRALIVDICPLHQQETGNAWAGRMLGMGSILGFFVGYIDLPYTFPFLGRNQIQILCVFAITCFLITVGITITYVKETPLIRSERRRKERWVKPLLRIVSAFWGLPPPIQSLCNVQLFASMAWFPYLFYSTTWIGERVPANPNTPPQTVDPDGTRAGSFALLLNSLLALSAVFIMPAITTFAHRYYSQEGSTYSGSISTQIAKFLKSLPKIWAASLLMYAICLFSTFWANDVTGATIIIAIIGIPWGISGWVPFTLIGEYVSTINGNELGQNDDYVAIRTSEEDDTLGKHVRRRSRGLSENESEYDEEHSSSETRPQSSSFGRRHRKKHKLDAGIIIGIHNIYIVIPQFVSTLLNAIIFALFQAVSPDSENDEVGWVLRISGIFAIISAGFAWKVIIVSGGRRGTVAFGGH